MINLLEKDN